LTSNERAIMIPRPQDRETGASLPSVVGRRLAEAREYRRLSQDDVAAVLGVSRVMVSHWERDERRPSELVLDRLAAIFGMPLQVLVDPEAPFPGSPAVPDASLVDLLYRDAESGIDAQAKAGLRDFVRFLDGYAELLERLGEPIYGLHHSPFSLRPGFAGRDDVRRKAEEARDWLRLGIGPVGDLAGLLDDAGITIYRAALGSDLKLGVSGAFLHHPSLGMSIAVNVETTPGRQLFTIAHELAHALYHSQTESRVVSYWGRKDDKELFADQWAGEFLVPQEGLRRASEALGIKAVRHAEEAVHLQRLFGVSYATMLVRLLVAKLTTADTYETLKQARPVALAAALGYAVREDEWRQDPSRWRLERFPRRFVRLLTAALRQERISPSSAASLTILTLDEMAELMSPPAGDGDDQVREELEQYTNVRERAAV
jgi:transcriptional regulator with XRE-family HTH domain/Zn-dependent peptidase ImmA (M78 family)